MTLVVDTDKCARCGVCEPECPHDAIVQTEDAYIIASALCTECRERYGDPRCVEVCPNDAIDKSKNSFYKKCFNLFG